VGRWFIVAYPLVDSTWRRTMQNIPENDSTRMIIERLKPQTENMVSIRRKELPAKYLFLNDNVWEGDNTPMDLAENHDDYLIAEISEENRETHHDTLYRC
jgi:hypothetical protein